MPLSCLCKHREFSGPPFISQRHVSLEGVAHRRNNMAKPIGTTARTGNRCPESGVWGAQTSPSTTAPIAVGNVMPPYRGNAVTWKLIRYA